MSTKEEAYSQIAALVERFGEQLPSYKKNDYNETLTRKDFIDPFFKALGWDMNNSQGNEEAYREVIHEENRIAFTDEKINKLVFELYGLGEEGNNKSKDY
jgi:predicted type IV restriction endonuclease